MNRRRTALFLDLDGTLAEIRPTPADVAPEPRRTRLLQDLTQRLEGRVAIISGRSLSEVDRILDAAIKPVGAVHGLVRRTADGVVETHAQPDALEPARRAAAAYVASRPGVTLEDKGVSLALHYRGAPEAAVEIGVAVRRLATEHGLRVQPGAMVLELCAPGANKGSALKMFLRDPPFSGAVPVMVGDDLTDEHAFAAAAAGGGFGVLVGAPRPTAARHRLESVEHVLEWLRQP